MIDEDHHHEVHKHTQGSAHRAEEVIPNGFFVAFVIFVVRSFDSETAVVDAQTY